MITSILKAVKVFFDADAAAAVYTAVNGRLYCPLAPENPTFPYLVFFPVSSVPQYMFGLRTIELVRIQFTIVSDKPNDAAQCATILDNLHTRFDNAVLVYGDSDYTNVWVERKESHGPMPFDDRMIATQDYLIMAQKVALG